ncbi:MAG TPA: RCC1 domain-containing protein, partial [Telluria sp.]
LERNREQGRPVQVGSAYKQVAVSGDHTLALKIDGTLWGWGDSAAGQLGAGTSTRLRPTQVILDSE